MKIRYNIANNKKMDFLRFILISAALAVVALGLLFVGVLNLSTNAKRFQHKKEELRIYVEKLQTMTRKNKEHKAEIENIKKKWRKERKFANGMIDNKIFPFLEQLGQLEEVLPAGVYINKLTLSATSGNRIQFTIAAISFAKLAEAYKVFLKYNMSIQKQTQAEGLYTANLLIKLD